MKANFDLKKWLWLAYPALVVGVILLSTNVLFGPVDLWGKLSVEQKQLKEQTEVATKLASKLAKLQAANLDAETKHLNDLLQVLPARKNLPALLAAVQLAASQSATTLESFRGQVGEVAASESAASTDALQLEVVLQIAAFDQLRQILNTLETSLPLVKVGQIKLETGKATLTVEGLWQALAKLPAGADYPVTDVGPAVARLKEQLQTYSSLPSGEAVIETGVNPAPFQ